jgi:uncharacterized membrane protein
MKQRYFNMSRIHGISDGVFAIAMTLLVLDIEVPQLTGDISGDVFKDIRGQSKNSQINFC